MPSGQLHQPPHTYPPEQAGVRLLRRLGGKPVSSELIEKTEELQKKLLKMRCPPSIAFWEYPILPFRKKYHVVQGLRYHSEGLTLLKKHGRYMDPENRRLLLAQYYHVNQRLNAILEEDFISVSREDCRIWKQMAKSFHALAELSSRDARGREVDFELPSRLFEDSPPSSGRSTPRASHHVRTPPSPVDVMDRVQQYIETIVPSANVRGLDLAVPFEELVNTEDREGFMPLVSHVSSFNTLVSQEALSILTADTEL